MAKEAIPVDPWRAESDARNLMETAAIMTDKQRHKAAQAHASKIAAQAMAASGKTDKKASTKPAAKPASKPVAKPAAKPTPKPAAKKPGK